MGFFANRRRVRSQARIAGAIDLMAALLPLEEEAAGLSYEDSCHRIGANALDIRRTAEGKNSLLKEISELERELDSTNAPNEICRLESELVAIHLAILIQGEESKKNGALYLPWRAADELHIDKWAYLGTGRRRCQTVTGYWPPRDILLQEHRRRVAFLLGMDHDVNVVMDELAAKYGTEATSGRAR